MDLKAKAMMPMHIGRFSLANHAWDEPFNKLIQTAEKQPFNLLTPQIGQPVLLNDKTQKYSQWWQEVKD